MCGRKLPPVDVRNCKREFILEHKVVLKDLLQGDGLPRGVVAVFSLSFFNSTIGLTLFLKLSKICDESFEISLLVRSTLGICWHFGNWNFNLAPGYALGMERSTTL